MKNKISTLLFACMCTSMLLAYDFEVGGVYFRHDWNDYDKILVTRDDNCNGYSGNLTIPSNVTYEGTTYDVVGISYDAFDCSYNLTSLYIPSSIQYLNGDGNPFSGLSNSELSITISPENPIFVCVNNAIYSKDLKTLYWMYFYDYYSDTYNVPSSVEVIKREAMHGSTNQVILSESVKIIEEYAMNNFYANSLKYEGTLEQFLQIERGEYAINSNIRTIYIQDELLKSITIPTSVTKIPAQMFYNIDSISAISIPTSVTSIGIEAFANTAYYRDESNWENGVLYIGDCLIKAKDTCTNVVVKEGTRLIADQAFSKGWSTNANLQSVVLPNSLKIIGNQAFMYCRNLTSINFPQSLTYLGQDAFGYSGINLYDDSMYDEDGVLYIGGILMKAKNTISGDYHIKEGTTMIKSSAFYDCDNLTSVTIPNSVTSIGQEAFHHCNSLKSVTIGSAVQELGSGAFSYCNQLNTVVWNVKNCKDFKYDDSYYYEIFYDTRINSFIFGDSVEYIPANLCRNLSLDSVIISDNVTKIGDYAFRSIGLKKVTIGKNVKEFGKEVFDNCYITTVIWNAKHADDIETRFDEYESIYNGLFYKGNNYYDSYNQITSFVFGDEVEYVPANLCYNLQNLTSINIPSSVTSIGFNAFEGCWNLKSVHISDIAAWCAIDFKYNEYYYEYSQVYSNPLSCADNLYLNGNLVKNVVLPDGVTMINNYIFPRNRIASITIPSSIASIGIGNIIPIYYFEGDIPATIQYNSFASDVYLIVDDPTPYKSAWTNYKSRIFPRATAIQNIEVTANSSLSSIHKKIGDENLENVIDLTLSGTINSYDLMIMRNKMINLRFLDLTDATIEANAYEYYTGYSSENNKLRNHSFKNLLSLKLPSSLVLADSVATECPDLKYLEINGGKVTGNMVPSSNLTVVLNEGVTEISSTAFAGRKGLRSISLPASLGTIAANTFKGCTSLESVFMSEGITAIGSNAFYGCTGLQNISLKEGLIKIDNSAFYGCTGLKSITIPASVMTIGNSAFHSAYSTSLLKDLCFAEGSHLQSIGSSAFYGCQIDSLIIPDSVRSIGTSAFESCSILKCVFLPDNPYLVSIANGTFRNCGAISSIHLPSSLEAIGEGAFAVKSGSTSGSLEIVIPEKVTTISRGAFEGRGSNLKHVAFPINLKSIEQQAFASCYALDSVSFPTSLQTIGDKAFQNCSGLKELRVPSTLLSVGDYAFSGCNNIKKVYTYTVEPVSINQNTFSCWQSANLYVPTTSYYTYYYNTQWSQFLSLKQFDEEYTYFYINNDYELDNSTGIIDGTPDADLNPGSGLIVTSDETQHVGVITVGSDENGAASVIACDNLEADSLILRLVTTKGKWSYFSFPCDVLLEQLNFAHQYVLREYNGATRAQYGSGGWVNMVGDVLQKGLGYIFQGAKTDTLEIVIPNPQFGCEDYDQVIKAYNATNLTNANWNFIGNPFPSWFDLDAIFESGYTSPIYIWNGTDYQVYRPGDDEYHLHPYEGFFTQNPTNGSSMLKWLSSGRETKSQADNKRGQGRHNMPARQSARRARQAEQQRYIINLTLASEDYSDQARIVFNNAASVDYELGRDAVKMDGGDAPLHIWSMEEKDAMTHLSINERPFGNMQVSLGYDVAADGFYTLSAPRMDIDVILYDNELKQEVDLSEGDYTFHSLAGTNNTRFSVIRAKQSPEMTTAVEDVDAVAEQIVNVYTILGAKIQSNVRRGDLKLEKGIYVLESLTGERSELVVEQ